MLTENIISQEEWDTAYDIELRKQARNDPKREEKAKHAAEQSLIGRCIDGTIDEAMKDAIDSGQINTQRKYNIREEAIKTLHGKRFTKMPNLWNRLWDIALAQEPEILAIGCRQSRTTSTDPQKFDWITIFQSEIQDLLRETRALTGSFDRIEALLQSDNLERFWLQALRETEIPPEIREIAELKTDSMLEGHSQICFDRLARDYNTTAVNLRQRWHRFQSKVMKRAEQLLVAHRAANP